MTSQGRRWVSFAVGSLVTGTLAACSAGADDPLLTGQAQQCMTDTEEGVSEAVSALPESPRSGRFDPLRQELDAPILEGDEYATYGEQDTKATFDPEYAASLAQPAAAAN